MKNKILISLAIASLTTSLNAKCNIELNRVLDVRGDIKVMKDNLIKEKYDISRSDDFKTLLSLHKIDREMTALYHQCTQKTLTNKGY